MKEILKYIKPVGNNVLVELDQFRLSAILERTESEPTTGRVLSVGTGRKRESPIVSEGDRVGFNPKLMIPVDWIKELRGERLAIINEKDLVYKES